MNILNITRETKILLIGVASICIISFAIAYLYYNGLNKSEDPRIVKTKFMFSNYDGLVKQKNYTNALLTLDSIEQILTNTQGYSNSYEMGIVLNNRASILISQALYETGDSVVKQSMLESASFYSLQAIQLYTSWIEQFEKRSKEEIRMDVQPYFLESDSAFYGFDHQKIIEKRVDDIMLAQKETPRRLSVALTNLGIIQRHQLKQKEAIESYIRAISLWKDNPTALSNLNVLYGKPPQDRSILKKLFPPDRKD